MHHVQRCVASPPVITHETFVFYFYTFWWKDEHLQTHLTTSYGCTASIHLVRRCKHAQVELSAGVIQSLSLKEPVRRGGEGRGEEREEERKGEGGGRSDRPLESQPLSPGARTNQPL